MVDDQLLSQAMRAYGRALAVADPIRLRFWDNRGLTMPQLRLMFLLLQQDGRAVGELAELMNVRPATVTGLTDRLVRHKLIVRLADEDDRRVVRIVLTHEGRRVVGEIETAARAYLDAVFQRMGEDAVRRLIAGFEQFSAAANEALREGAAQV
ncbi:MAG: hypothetical protein A2148_12555 [Chloroflexi bacterium RBG_16_68_14]|nr:MAG: hypothetical protein A2148_12555 [Chloroflexi bacterium RBG_16_68_14]